MAQLSKESWMSMCSRNFTSEIRPEWWVSMQIYTEEESKTHPLWQWYLKPHPSEVMGWASKRVGSGWSDLLLVFWISCMACVQEALAGFSVLLCFRCLLKRCWLGELCEQNCSSGSASAFYLCLAGLMGKMMSGSRLTRKAHGSYLALPLCYFVCLVGMQT